MKVDTTSLAGASLTKMETSADTVDAGRKKAQDGLSTSTDQQGSAKSVPPEEILDKIKALTEDGSYSVRFEKDQKTDKLVIRVVDSKSGDLIRQIPPEDVLELSQSLEKLQGNLVNATG